MIAHSRAPLLALASLLLVSMSRDARADILLSANEGKYDLSSGVGRAVENPEPDSLTVLDFVTFPPHVRQIVGVANSVVGPPTNVAITPNERLALVANSVRQYTVDPQRPVPDDTVQILDLAAKSPRIIGTVRVGKQPSGVAIDRGGRLAMVANRADGTVSVLSIDGTSVTVRQTISVGEPSSEPADVAINPAGTLALVSLNKAGLVRVLRIKDGHVELADRKLPAYGQPYHAQITPDGLLGLVAGGGNQKGPDADLLTVIDLAVDPVRTINHLIVGTGPESFDISPDGSLVAVVLMESSNVPADDAQRTEHGRMQLWKRSAKTFSKCADIPIGRIPEGVCFTADGRHLVVQEHAARQLAIYSVTDDSVRDTEVRIPTPGFPSSLRRADPAR